MSSRTSRPGKNSAAIALCGLLAAVAVAVFCAASAHAADYKMLLCAGGNGSNDYGTSTNSPHFKIQKGCGPAPDPAQEAAFIQISEEADDGNMSDGAYAFAHWDTPPWVHYRQAGGWTRQPHSFNEGWRSRFWIDGGSAGNRQIFVQGFGLPDSGELAPSWPTFGQHLWHQGGYLDATRFAFELRCIRPAGCPRQGFNATQLNTMNFVLADESPSQVSMGPTGDPIMDEAWVRGKHWLGWNWTERGSGLRYERVWIDSTLFFVIEQGCDLGWSAWSGEFARSFRPCPAAENFFRSQPLETNDVPDGAHWVTTCTQDYGQAQGYAGSGGQTCTGRVIRTDNTAPGAPTNLVVTSDNPNRYLDRFGAQFALPPNQGSPITKAHVEVVNAAGEAVMPEKVISAVNPTAIADIAGPARPGAYEIRVRLEDEVGHVGPPASAPIPRDTTPPAAPQLLSVAAPSSSRTTEGFDLRWHNIPDVGAPIEAAHYQVLDGAGKVVVATQDINQEGIQAIRDLETASDAGAYSLRLWLSDAEGNVGAPTTAPLAYDCEGSRASGGTSLSAGIESGATVVDEGQGATLSGALRGQSGGVGLASVCVYSSVVTDRQRDFLGLAISDRGGNYRFPVGPGPSRSFSLVYRDGQRQVTAATALATRVRPTLKVRSKVVRNKRFGVYTGTIPGPHNEDVVVVLRVKDGKHSRVFRETRTGTGGAFQMRYRYLNTRTPTTYVLIAKVPSQAAYPYEGGESRPARQRVKP